MSAAPVLIAAWARSAIAPVGGAFRQLEPHQIAAPVILALLARAGIPPGAVDAVVAGNALGAGGNPARMAALASGLGDRCPAWSVDSQCCAGLDAVRMAAALIASGQAQVVVAGGVEAWSRAPIRLRRPLHPGEAPLEYERPAFCPDPERDPDLIESATRCAAELRISRAEQDAWAVASHARATAARARQRAEIVEVAGLADDAYPRALSAERAARLPRVGAASGAEEFAPGLAGVSPKADGAAFVLLVSPAAAQSLGIAPRAEWLTGLSVGADPVRPMLAAASAAQAVLKKTRLRAADIARVELHDAFAAQGIEFKRSLGLAAETLNGGGGGLVRGHPIGASGTVALVRVLAELAPGELGLAAIAGAGGLGAAALVKAL